MARLIIKNKAEVIQVHDLIQLPDRFDIGSDEGNDIIIDDKKISLTHITLEKEENGYFITDNRTAFGTMLNGVKIGKRTEIKNGDVITIGEHDLVFEDDTRNMVGEKISEGETVILDSGPGEKTKITRVHEEGETVFLEDLKSIQGEKTKIIGIKESYYFLAIYGPYRGKRFLLNPEETRIGRDSSLNDIVINRDKKGNSDTSISRRHATVSVKGGRFYLSDKRSKTRTYCNTAKLDEEDIVELKEKDEIEIVSDKKSTIFRFVKEGNWDFSSPHKAGVLWVRYRPIATYILTAVFGFLLLFNFISSCSMYSVITQKPGTLKISAKLWLKGESIQKGEEIKDENGISYRPSPLLCKMDERIGVVLLDGKGNIIGFDGKTKQPLWPNIDANGILPHSPVLADLDGDGEAEIAVSSGDSRIYVYDARSGLLKYKSKLLGGQLAGSPSIGDVNGDGKNDIVVCSENGWLYIALNSAGDFVWRDIQLDIQIKNTPTLNDLNNDNKQEIIIGTESGKLMIISLNKEPVIIDINESLRSVKGTYAEYHSIRSGVAVSKIDAYRKAIMVITRQLNGLTLNSEDYSVLGYDEYPNPGFQYPILYASPLAADLDSNERLDFVVAASNGSIMGYTYQMKNNENLLWSYQLAENDIITTTPSMCDFNKDHIPDVAITSSSGTLTILNGKNGHALFSKTYQDRSFVTSPVIGDIDGNGWIDIVSQCANRDVIQFTTNMKLFKNSIIWNQAGGGAKHAGIFITKLPASKKHLQGVWFYGILILLLFIYHYYQFNMQRKMETGKDFWTPKIPKISKRD